MLATEIDSDGIAVLRLDNGRHRNALSIAMRDAICDTLDEWAAYDRVRVVVLTGAGTTFCAGFDCRRDSHLDQAIATARVMAEAPQAALEATKCYLITSAGATFDKAFEVEHDRVFDEFLLGAFGPGSAT